MVQLGAFGDSAKADAAWAALNKRFGFLAGMNRKIAETNVEGGRKVFRLQAVTANSSEAQQLCAKLKVAGENCLIVR
jgi:cell division protein FtsN